MTRGAARLLRVPPVPDGAVGRPGRDRVHRRPRDRRDARPQRPAPRPLATRRATAGSCSRPRPACSTSRREHRAQGPAAAGQALPRRPRRRAASSPTRRSKREIATQQPYARVGRATSSVRLADLPRAATPPSRRREPLRTRQLAVRLHAGGHEGDPRAARAQRRGAGRLDGQRHAARGALRAQAAPLLVLQAALRAGDEPADRLDPRGDRDERRARASAPSATCSTRRPSTRASSSSTTRSCSTDELEQLRTVDSRRVQVVDDRHDVAAPPKAPTASSARSSGICDEADVALAAGANILILSDRSAGPGRVPIPSLLATAAVHHHLVREGTRLQAGIVVESGEPRSVHSIAVLVGYGAAAVNPYLMLETLARARRARLAAAGMTADRRGTARRRPSRKGLLKTMSKMGISTMPSYCGAQIFEAVGLAPELVERHFTGTPSRIGGIGIRELAEESLARHARAYPERADAAAAGGRPLRVAARRRAPPVEPGHDRAAAARGARAARPRRTRSTRARSTTSTRAPLDAARRCCASATTASDPARRGRARARDREALLDRRDVARLDLARGARDARRRDEPHRRPLEHRRGRRGSRCASATTGARRSSRSRRAASASTAHYLANADELQIKMAQGAKPGEGGQLPGPQGRRATSRACA